MPPKSLLTSSDGLTSNSTAIEAEKELAFDWKQRPSIPDNPQDLAAPETAEREQQPQVPVSVIPKPSAPTLVGANGPRLTPRNRWEGAVSQVNTDRFVAILRDMTSPKNPDEEAVFDFCEISPSDREFVRVGAFFHLTIGTETSPAGQVRNVSIINFRRVPDWTRGAIARVADRVEQWKGLLAHAQ